MVKTNEIIIDDLINPEIRATPEQILWLAVIERAILDYCFPETSLMAADKRTLVPFLFGNTPKPYNLVYICNILFDFPDSVEVIRKRISHLKIDGVSTARQIRAKQARGSL